MLANLSDWLSHTSLSRVIRELEWLIPATQTVHLLAIAALFTAAARLTFELWRPASTVTLPLVAGRYLPVVWAGLGVLLGSGLMLVVGEPARELMNDVFRTKMLMVLVAVLLTVALGAALRSPASGRPGLSRGLGAMAMLLWIAIVVAGRWIAYSIDG